ncbi:MAG: hypothetical protein AAGB51_11715 [Planctomycetota bacterium]
MTILRDAELRNGASDWLQGMPDHTGTGTRDDLIQAASIDLQVGAIYRPGTPQNKRGQAIPVGRRCCIDQGGTVIVTTKQHFQLPANIAALNFPPSSQALRGLLLVNPGHVDPGFQGPLKLMIINMGEDAAEIRVGDRIVTSVFYKLAESAEADYRARGGSTGAEPTVEQVRQLSPDFLSVDKRAREAVHEARINSTIIASVLTTVLSGGIVLLTQFYDNSGLNADIQRLEAQAAVEQEIDTLQNQVESLLEQGETQQELIKSLQANIDARGSQNEE